MKSGRGCCLDANNNSICDNDEVTLNETGNKTENEPCVILEFYGEGCSHCAKMIPVVAQVENETSVKFRRLEIWYNKTNQDIFHTYGDKIQRDCGALGVPTFTSLKTNRSRCGEMIASDLKYFVMQNCGKT
jgi:thiol-disulfide isomerase/thioredoxin